MTYALSTPAPSATGSSEEQALDAIRSLATRVGRNVLVLIDEVDVVEDTSGLGSFIRYASSATIKFLLVGVARDVPTLIHDHQSLARINDPISVPSMLPRELDLIIDAAQKAVGQRGLDVRFDDDARRTLVDFADGVPWFIHVLGQRSLRHTGDRMAASAERNSPAYVVTYDDVVRSRDALVSGPFSHQYAVTYERAVAGSREREIVLRTYAQTRSEVFRVASIHKFLRERLGVSRPGMYRSHLRKGSHGTVISDGPLGDQNTAQFTSAIFKTYTRLRPSVMPDIDDIVVEAWQEWQLERAP